MVEMGTGAGTESLETLGGGVDGGGVDAAEEMIEGVLDFGGLFPLAGETEERCNLGIGNFCNMPATIHSIVGEYGE